MKRAVVVAGLAAGTTATLAELLLWWLAGKPLPETLYGDARLTAALLLGQGVLPPPSSARWDILLAATAIHFSLSILYAWIFSRFPARPSARRGLVAGAIYGLAIYGINLYGFTLLFPWFSQARGWVTLAAHLVFGLTLAACRLIPELKRSLIRR